MFLCHIQLDLHLNWELRAGTLTKMVMTCRTTSLCFVVCSVLLQCCVHMAGSAKILVVSAEGSHWLNIKTLMMELLNRGHTFTVLRPSNSISIEEESSEFKVETIQLPEDSTLSKEDTAKKFLGFIFKSAFAKDVSPLSNIWETFKLVEYIARMTAEVLEATFENKVLLERLQAARFELVLADAVNAGGVMLAHYLKLPVVLFGRWMSTGDIQFAIAPSPLSYVPVTHSRVTDKMGFTERFRNVFLYSVNQFLFHLFIYPVYDELCQRYLNAERGLHDMYKKADIYLIKVDFVFEYPRPIMPNALYIGGFQCRPSKTLPAEIEEFMDSSGEQGVVVFSLGTSVPTLPINIANKMAAGFALLPEHVIWCYTGKTPSTLGNNTKLLSWLPQNDILGHPKTKAFISHGGGNSVYEAIYHGVPVVGFPLFADQYENILRLKSRGAAIVMENLSEFTSEDIYNAVRTVIDNPSYKANMKRMSTLHRDVLVHPMEAAIFWTEFTIRHKGASHLKAAGNDLPFYQYHMLDVIGLLVVVLFISMFTAWKLFKAVVNRICQGPKKRKQD